MCLIKQAREGAVASPTGASSTIRCLRRLRMQDTAWHMRGAAKAKALARSSGQVTLLLQRDSHDKSLSRGRQEVLLLVDKLGIHPRLKTIEEAENLYKLALSRNFTRGRRTNQVTL